MQTFLTYPSFAETAASLDRQRLGKQRVEGLQILNLLKPGSTKRGHRQHPVVAMWQNNAIELFSYVDEICTEWLKQGYKDTVRETIHEQHFDWCYNFDSDLNSWLYDNAEYERVITTHRGALYLKDPIHYAQWEAESIAAYDLVCHDDCNYYWPNHRAS